MSHQSALVLIVCRDKTRSVIGTANDSHPPHNRQHYTALLVLPVLLSVSTHPPGQWRFQSRQGSKGLHATQTAGSDDGDNESPLPPPFFIGWSCEKTHLWCNPVRQTDQRPCPLWLFHSMQPPIQSRTTCVQFDDCYQRNCY